MKKRNHRPAFVLYTFILICSYALSCRSIDSKLDGDQNIRAEGASNTRGVGSTFPLDVRLISHLKANNIDYKSILKDQSLLISADFFFPTNYPHFSNENIGLEEFEGFVRATLKDLKSRYTYLVMCDLFDLDDIYHRDTLDKYNAEKDGEFEALTNIHNVLHENRLRTKKVRLVNRILQEEDERNSKFFTVRFSSFAGQIIRKDGYVREGIKLNIGPKGLFDDDLIHLNNNGQVAALNYSFIPILNKLPIFQDNPIPLLDMEYSYGTRWKKEVINNIFLTPQNFAEGKNGDYWFELVNENSFASKSTKLRGQSNELEKIKSRINLNTYLRSDYGHYVGLTEKNNETVLTLDLSKTIFFTSIDLKETFPGSNRFVAWGYDYWSTVRGHPYVNYRYEATITASNKLKVIWDIFPLTGSQEKRLAREGFLDPKVISEIENAGSSFPRLRYEFEIAPAG
jgi:hypothetical protein